MCVSDRVLAYGDCAVNPNPNAEQLADIAISSAETAGMFGIEPRVAMCSYAPKNTGNNLYKALQRSAGAVAVGSVLQGLNEPVNDLSRECTITDIVNTVAITAILAQAARQPGTY